MWLPWSRSTLDGLGVFLEYSIPNAIMEGFFLFSLELIVGISGYGIIINHESNVSKRDFSAITVSMNILSLIMIISCGVSYAVSAIIGKFLSSNKYTTGKKYVAMIVCFGLFLVLFIMIIMHKNSTKILKQYLNSEDTVNRMIDSLPFFFGLMFLLSFYGICNGIVKGLGL
jgi:Na+-driven multidrug efflux pump